MVRRSHLLLSLLLALALAHTAAWPPPYARGAEANGVRDRLVRVAETSRALFRQGKPLDEVTLRNWQPGPMVHEDYSASAAPADRRFPLLSDADRYDDARGWGIAYFPKACTIAPGIRVWPAAQFCPRRVVSAVDTWPGSADAPALRSLLTDADPAIRGLAVEALATLHHPEDAGHIGALLDDVAESTPVLGYNLQITSNPNSAPQNGTVPLREWHVRTVQTYVREALKLMTGRRFDGRDPPA